MPQTKLSITLPKDAWVGSVTRAYPAVQFTVLAALPTGETGVALVELTGQDVDRAVSAVRDHRGVRSLEELGRTERRTLVEIETDAPLLLFSGQAAGVPIEPPVEIRDGVASLETTAPVDKLSDFGDQLERFGLSFDVEYLHQTVDGVDELLTERQRDLVTAAVEHGYYDTPRTCTLTELADRLDTAKSSVSETLHRAEEAIVKEYVTGQDRKQRVAPVTSR